MQNKAIPVGRRIVLVHWKNPINQYEIFSNLKNFCLSHPQFSYDTLNNYLSKRKTPYENELIKIERKPIITKASPPQKPMFPKRLFWEFKYDEMNWQKDSDLVIERVVERGTPKEWAEMVRFYGKSKVVKILRKEPYLTDRAIEKVCDYFDLKPTELKCYIKKQSQLQHWI